MTGQHDDKHDNQNNDEPYNQCPPIRGNNSDELLNFFTIEDGIGESCQRSLPISKTTHVEEVAVPYEVVAGEANLENLPLVARQQFPCRFIFSGKINS